MPVAGEGKKGRKQDFLSGWNYLISGFFAEIPQYVHSKGGRRILDGGRTYRRMI